MRNDMAIRQGGGRGRIVPVGEPVLKARRAIYQACSIEVRWRQLG